MNNFRRQYGEERTVSYTNYEITSVSFSNIVITNGSFTISKADGATAPLLISADYSITTALVTYYSDGTTELSDSTTYTGTHTFTEFGIVTSFFTFCYLLPSITLSNNTQYNVRLFNSNNESGNSNDIGFPSTTGNEEDSYVNIGVTYNNPRDLKVHVVNQGSNYAVTITKNE